MLSTKLIKSLLVRRWKKSWILNSLVTCKGLPKLFVSGFMFPFTLPSLLSPFFKKNCRCRKEKKSTEIAHFIHVSLRDPYNPTTSDIVLFRSTSTLLSFLWFSRIPFYHSYHHYPTNTRSNINSSSPHLLPHAFCIQIFPSHAYFTSHLKFGTL